MEAYLSKASADVVSARCDLHVKYGRGLAGRATIARRAFLIPGEMIVLDGDALLLFLVFLLQAATVVVRLGFPNKIDRTMEQALSLRTIER